MNPTYVLQQVDIYLQFIRVLLNGVANSEQAQQIDQATEEYRTKVREILQNTTVS